jgi:hypothetical protein
MGVWNSHTPGAGFAGSRYWEKRGRIAAGNDDLLTDSLRMMQSIK